MKHEQNLVMMPYEILLDLIKDSTGHTGNFYADQNFLLILKDENEKKEHKINLEARENKFKWIIKKVEEMIENDEIKLLNISLKI